jgi:hypothetical protein
VLVKWHTIQTEKVAVAVHTGTNLALVTIMVLVMQTGGLPMVNGVLVVGMVITLRIIHLLLTVALVSLLYITTHKGL